MHTQKKKFCIIHVLTLLLSSIKRNSFVRSLSLCVCTPLPALCTRARVYFCYRVIGWETGKGERSSVMPFIYRDLFLVLRN